MSQRAAAPDRSAAVVAVAAVAALEAPAAVVFAIVGARRGAFEALEAVVRISRYVRLTGSAAEGVKAGKRVPNEAAGNVGVAEETPRKTGVAKETPRKAAVAADSTTDLPAPEDWRC